jgi:hypothetical protein
MARRIPFPPEPSGLSGYPSMNARAEIGRPLKRLSIFSRTRPSRRDSRDGYRRHDRVRRSQRLRPGPTATFLGILQHGEHAVPQREQLRAERERRRPAFSRANLPVPVLCLRRQLQRIGWCVGQLCEATRHQPVRRQLDGVQTAVCPATAQRAGRGDAIAGRCGCARPGRHVPAHWPRRTGRLPEVSVVAG